MRKNVYELWDEVSMIGGSGRSEGIRLKKGDDMVLIFDIWEKDELCVGIKEEKDGRVSMRKEELLKLLMMFGKKFCVGG